MRACPKAENRGRPERPHGRRPFPPRPDRRALPSWRQTVSRELHALSSAPYTAQAGVIDAGRGLARAVPTVRRDPVAGAVPAALWWWRAGAAVTFPPTPPKVEHYNSRHPPPIMLSGPLQCTDCGLRHPFKRGPVAGKPAAVSKRLREERRHPPTPLRFCTLVTPQPRPYPSWKLLEGQGGTAPQGNAHEPRAPCPTPSITLSARVI